MGSEGDIQVLIYINRLVQLDNEGQIKSEDGRKVKLCNGYKMCDHTGANCLYQQEDWRKLVVVDGQIHPNLMPI